MSSPLFKRATEAFHRKLRQAPLLLPFAFPTQTKQLKDEKQIQAMAGAVDTANNFEQSYDLYEKIHNCLSNAPEKRAREIVGAPKHCSRSEGNELVSAFSWSLTAKIIGRYPDHLETFLDRASALQKKLRVTRGKGVPAFPNLYPGCITKSVWALPDEYNEQIFKTLDSLCKNDAYYMHKCLIKPITDFFSFKSDGYTESHQRFQNWIRWGSNQVKFDVLYDLLENAIHGAAGGFDAGLHECGKLSPKMSVPERLHWIYSTPTKPVDRMTGVDEVIQNCHWGVAERCGRISALILSPSLQTGTMDRRIFAVVANDNKSKTLYYTHGLHMRKFDELLVKTREWPHATEQMIENIALFEKAARVIARKMRIDKPLMDVLVESTAADHPLRRAHRFDAPRAKNLG